MRYLDRFKTMFGQKKEARLSEVEVETIIDIIDMFADDNNMSSDVVWDVSDLKDINYYTKYDSRAELSDAHDANLDINFNVHSPNLDQRNRWREGFEYVEIKDIHGYMDLEDKYPEGNVLMDKMFKLLSRIKKMYPKLKYKMPSGPNKWHVRIEK